MIDPRIFWVKPTRKLIKLFNEVDQLQRLLAGPIPEDIWNSNSSADVQDYLKRIALPRTEEDDHIGTVNANFVLF